MATTIRLDATALRKLLEDSPEFKLELQRAVLAEVLRGMYRSDVPDAMLKVVDGLFAQERTVLVEALKDEKAIGEYLIKAMDKLVQKTKDMWGNTKIEGLSAETKSRIDNEVNLYLHSAITKTITVNAESILASLGGSMDERILKRVDRLMAAEVDKRVDERMKAIMQLVAK